MTRLVDDALALVGEEGTINAMKWLDAEWRKLYAKNDDEICQILGKALEYPWYKDDKENFPGATEKDGVCVAPCVASDLAETAAKRIAQLKAERDGWFDFAGAMSCNADFYRGLVERCGKAIGKQAYTSDDGSVQDSVLALRVPEIIEKTFEQKTGAGTCSPRKKPGLLTRIRYALAIIFKG